MLGWLLNLGASVFIFAWTQLNADSVLGCTCAVISTIFYHRSDTDGINMSWLVVSLVVIFPISQGIGMAFKRREVALKQLGILVGNLRAVWGAAHTWTVKSASSPSGFKRVLNLYPEPEDAKLQMRQLFEELLTSLITYFNIPRWGRARHQFTCSGVCDEDEQRMLSRLSHQHLLAVDGALGRMQRMVQDFKAKGLPGGEAHRLDQYISKISIAFENLTVIKEYRTPQAFRAFARVNILVVTVLYGELLSFICCTYVASCSCLFAVACMLLF